MSGSAPETQAPATEVLTDDIQAISPLGRLVALPVEERESDDTIDEWLSQNVRDDVTGSGPVAWVLPVTLPRWSTLSAG